MAGILPTEFSQESVRQLMLANGGRITNHELVKSYRRWLTDPACREDARVQFKDFVNNLATIKQEDGEKYLVLKKKYFPEFYHNDKSQIISPQYQQDFYTNNPEKIYERSGYMPSPSSGYSSSSGGHTQSPGYATSPTSYSNNGPSSLNSPPSLISPPSHQSGGGRSSSPSLLDEVMAGFNPPSRTMSRQPSSLPPAPQSFNNSNQTGYQSSSRGGGGGYQQQPPYQQQTSSSHQPPSYPQGSQRGYSNGTTNSIVNNHPTNYNNFAQQQQQQPLPPQLGSRYNNGYPGQQPPSIQQQHSNNNSIRSESRQQDLRYDSTSNKRTSSKDLRYINNQPNNIINGDPRLIQADPRLIQGDPRLTNGDPRLIQRQDSRLSINQPSSLNYGPPSGGGIVTPPSYLPPGGGSMTSPPYLPERQTSRSELLPPPAVSRAGAYERQNSAPSPAGGSGGGLPESEYNPNAFSPHFTANSRYSITSTASHSSGGSQIPGGQAPYPGAPGGVQPGRSNSSPHQPYQPVYPDASKRSALYTRTMSNSGLPNPLGYTSPIQSQLPSSYQQSPAPPSSYQQSPAPPSSSYPQQQITSPPTRISPSLSQHSLSSPRHHSISQPHHHHSAGTPHVDALGLPLAQPPALPPARSSVTSLDTISGLSDRRNSSSSLGKPPEPPPYRPPPPELGLPPRPGSSAVSRQNSALPPRPGSRPNVAPPPVPNMDPRRNSTTSLLSLSSHGLPPPPERPSRLDLNPPDLGLPPREIKQRPLHSSAGSRPELQQVGAGDRGMSNQKSSGSLSKSYGNLTATSAASSSSIDEDKENFRLGASHSVDNLSEEAISVRERTKTFNRMASDVSLTGSSTKLSSIVKRRNSRAIEMGMMSRRGSAHSNRGGGEDDSLPDTSSITTLDPTIKSFMIQAAKGDYQTMAKMLNENPKLVRHKDLTCGYTALHWAAKHGDMDTVKLIAGTFKAQVNIKSNGGYTPLHLSAQHGHQDVFDLLVGAYGADANIRDFSGKRARQYLTTHSEANSNTLSLSSDTFRQLKDRRRTGTNRLEKNQRNQSGGMLRFGSISVKVKKTTEAFNNYFHSHSSSSHSTSGSNGKFGGQPDSQKMPPPKFAPIKKRKSKRTIDFGLSRSAPTTPVGKPPVAAVIPEVEERGSDSDSEFG